MKVQVFAESLADVRVVSGKKNPAQKFQILKVFLSGVGDLPKGVTCPVDAFISGDEDLPEAGSYEVPVDRFIQVESQGVRFGFFGLVRKLRP